MKLKWSILNDDDLKDMLKNYDQRLDHRLGTALSRAGLFVKREAQLRVPVDTGALKNSARTKLTRRTKLQSEVNISFNVHYAVKIHETHRWGSKYLENAYRENIGEIRRILIQGMA